MCSKKISSLLVLAGLTTAVLLLLNGCAPPPRNLQPLRKSTPVAAAVSQNGTSLSTATPFATFTPIPTSPPLSATSIPTVSVTLAPVATCQPEAMAEMMLWCYDSPLGDTFIHPIAFESDDRMGYLLDSGRVLQLPLDHAAPPRNLLAPGYVISGTRVIEPLDIALTTEALFALDRAGDVYRYDLVTEEWSLDRYDRPIDDLSSHYYVALAADQSRRYLLETSYSFGLRYEPDTAERLWRVPEGYVVDMAVQADVYYTLYRPFTSTLATVSRSAEGVYLDLPLMEQGLEIERPRQLKIEGDDLYLLDQGGERLLRLGLDGALQAQWDFSQPISSFTLFQETIVLAARNSLMFVDRPASETIIPSAAYLTTAQPHDPVVLASLPELILPIPNLPVHGRDLRLPGAPRHYRLGVHEGLDFYWGPGREIFAVADATILRLVDDYTPPDEQAFVYWRNQALTAGYTPDDVLDFYRGRQLWLQHDNGLISRHAHLSEIAEGLEEGGRVAQGDFIGRVGNSGSPASLNDPAADSHLHFELWIGEQFVGQYLRPIETRELLEQLFVE